MKRKTARKVIVGIVGIIVISFLLGAGAIKAQETEAEWEAKRLLIAAQLFQDAIYLNQKAADGVKVSEWRVVRIPITSQMEGEAFKEVFENDVIIKEQIVDKDYEWIAIWLREASPPLTVSYLRFLYYLKQRVKEEEG